MIKPVIIEIQAVYCVLHILLDEPRTGSHKHIRKLSFSSHLPIRIQFLEGGIYVRQGYCNNAFFPFSVLGIKPRVSHMLYHWATTPAWSNAFIYLINSFI